jgi:hypothetical protein
MTRHNHQMIFGRRVDGCARCQELADGAPVRSWNRRRFLASYEQQRIREIDSHFAPGGRHARDACGPVCTFGDW